MAMLPDIKTKRRDTLFAKYIRYFAVIEILSFVAFGCVICYFVSNIWENEQKQKLYDYAAGVSDVFSQYSSAGFDEDAVYNLNHAIAGVSAAANADVFVVDQTGKVVLCSDNEQGGAQTCPVHSKIKIPGEVYMGIKTDGGMATKSDLGGVYQADRLVAASVVENAARKDVFGIVFAVQPLESGLSPYVVRFLQIYVMAAIAIIVITWLITYFSTYSLTKPLRDIAKATRHYAEGDFSYRINCSEPGSVREFDELSATINSMADNLQQLEMSRSNFVANVSHELKTPMTTIGGFIDGILDGTIDNEHQKKYLAIVSSEVKRLSRLIASMLNISKMEAGELRINPVKFNLTQLILGIFISFEQKIKDKDIDVKGLDYLSTAYIEADQDMINQVFYNLIDNAVKFTDKDGEISVQMAVEEEYVSFLIRNTGKGIAAADIDHVFERFYKGDKSRSMDTKSAGLGLFIVKNIVELHHGEITVRNIGDKYTEFTVKLKIKLMDV